jgi:hypothetical protein
LLRVIGLYQTLAIPASESVAAKERHEMKLFALLAIIAWQKSVASE